jgi:hypothetical protein
MRDGAFTLLDVCEPHADGGLPAVRPARAIRCRKADREAQGRENPLLLAEITNCPKAQSTNIYDRCKAKYEGLSTR